MELNGRLGIVPTGGISSVHALYFLCIFSVLPLYRTQRRVSEKGLLYIGRRIGAEEAGMRAEVSALASRSMRARTLSWMGA